MKTPSSLCSEAFDADAPHRESPEPWSSVQVSKPSPTLSVVSMNLHLLPQPDCLTHFPQDLTCALSAFIPLLMKKTSLPFCLALTPQCLAEPMLGAPLAFAE